MSWKELFRERFDCWQGEIPGGWLVERNSDLTASGIRRGLGCFELLSAGNKFIPVIPDLHDLCVDLKVSINYSMGKSFGLLLGFCYDLRRRCGAGIQIRCSEESGLLTIAHGRLAANCFHPFAIQEFPCPDAKRLDHPFAIRLEVTGSLARVSVAGVTADFAVSPDGVGKVTLAREHFLDVMKILSFRIQAPECPVPARRTSFTMPIAVGATMYPLFCDVSLLDFGDCMEARLAFRGGVAETEPGEGDYHVARADLFNRPFLKVITAKATEEFVLYDAEFVNVVKHLVPAYFYGVLHHRVPWPLRRSVRFMKPCGAFDLAVGFESFCQSTMQSHAQAPAETQFSLKGEVIHSGVGISSGKIVVSFLSNPKKRFAALLPQSDPRLSQARAFVAANHFFLEGECVNFRIILHGKSLPLTFEVRLEDA
ncbi:MAG: hypothetical protein IKR13_04245, partial [Victivallales bacterium]|nr:hypothetical protein [Victivallales bacterium]